MAQMRPRLDALAAGRRRRRIRLPCRAGAASARLAAAGRARMGLPAGPRTPATVAAVPPLQPSLHSRLHRPADSPPAPDAGALAAATTPETAGMNGPGDQPDFLSGHSGHVAGVRQTSKAVLTDLLDDGWAAVRLQRRRLRRAARARRGSASWCWPSSGRTSPTCSRRRARNCCARATTSVRKHRRSEIAASSRTSTRCCAPTRRMGTTGCSSSMTTLCCHAGFLDVVPVPRRTVRVSPRPARPPQPLPRGVGGDPSPHGERRARDCVRRDRAGHCVSPRDVRCAAAVSGAPHRLGPRRPLVRARARARLAYRDHRRDARPPQSAPSRHLIPAPSRSRGGSRFPCRSAAYKRPRSAANARRVSVLAVSTDPSLRVSSLGVARSGGAPANGRTDNRAAVWHGVLSLDLALGLGLATGLAVVAFVTTGGEDLGPNTWTEIVLTIIGAASRSPCC